MTVSEAFDAFKSELELPDRKQREASVAQQDIRARISQYLDVPSSFLSGSYARHTKIFPLKDIDLILVRNCAPVGLTSDGSGVSPGQALDEVVGAVRKAYPLAATAAKQARSVNVQLSGLEFGFDLVPAWLRHPDGYWIPDTDRGAWIPTDPDAHAQFMTQSNERCGGKLKPVIKMVKHWSRRNYDLLSSFHLELLCSDSFGGGEIPNYQIGVAAVLVHMQRHATQQMMDPIYGISRVDKSLSSEDQVRITNRIISDANNAVEALRMEKVGRHSEAIEKWKFIFVSGFPT
jgi:SMODS domain-containing protein